MSNDSASFAGAAVPTEFNTIPQEEVAALPGDVTVAVVWEFDYQGTTHTVTFHTDPVVSDRVDIERGFTGSLVEVNTTTWDLKFTFGLASDYETRAYSVTWINGLSEESEMSLPVEVTLQPGREEVRIAVDVPTLLAKITALGISDGRYPLHGFRLYRSTGGEFFYVGTMAGDLAPVLPGESYLPKTTSGNTMYFYDRVTGAGLGDACSTDGYIMDAAELQQLRGLTTVYNGILAAFKNNEVWLSEPYIPWGWKRKHVLTLPNKVIDIFTGEQGLYAFTEGGTYFMSGQQPSDFVPTKLAGKFACLNKGAVTSVDGLIVFFSTDGPVLVRGAGQNLDQTVMSRDSWREMLTSFSGSGGKVILTTYGSKVLVSFGGRTLDIGATVTAGAMMVDLNNGSWTFVEDAPLFVMNLPPLTYAREHDELVFSSGTGTQWKIFADDTQVTNTRWAWHSKDYVLPKPVNFGAIQVFGSGTVEVRILANGVEKAYKSLSANSQGIIARLPGGFKAERWSIEFRGTGNAEVTRAFLAHTLEELRNV
jgi:hypothetical protein